MRTLASTLVALAAFGCGGAQTTPQAPVGPDPCVAGKAHLEQRLGPELSKFETAQPLPAARGCALVYLKVAEEMPEEMEDGDDLQMYTDHELAFAFAKGSTVTVDPVPRSKMAPGPVVMKLTGKDVTGDGVAELIVEETQGEYGMTKYRGLRIFDWSRGTGREVFAEKLSVTTPEGLTIVPEWKVGVLDGSTRAIVFDGAGTQVFYAWDASAHRFVRKESVTPGPAKPKAAEPAGDDPPMVGDDAGGADDTGDTGEKGGNVLDDLGL